MKQLFCLSFFKKSIVVINKILRGKRKWLGCLPFKPTQIWTIFHHNGTLEPSNVVLFLVSTAYREVEQLGVYMTWLRWFTITIAADMGKIKRYL